MSERRRRASVGIEFEMDVWNTRTRSFVSNSSLSRFWDRVSAPRGWRRTWDGTVGIELISRPHTSVREYARDIATVANAWLSEHPHLLPFFQSGGSSGGTYVGHHHHIGGGVQSGGGLGGRGRNITSLKRAITLHLKRTYPLLIALAVNDYRDGWCSRRGRTCSFVRNLPSGVSIIEGGTMGDTGHYTEINASPHGTVEFRRYDGNIPQVQLTIMAVEAAVASAALNGTSLPSQKPYSGSWRREITRVTRLGLAGIDVQVYMEYLMVNYGDFFESNLPECVSEILGIALLGKTVTDVSREVGVHDSKIKQVRYYEAMWRNPERYLQILEELRYNVPVAYHQRYNIEAGIAGDFYPPLAGRGNHLLRTQWVTRWENAGLSRAQILEKLERDLAPRTAGEELRMIRVIRHARDANGGFDTAMRAIQRHWTRENPEQVIRLLRPDLLSKYYENQLGEFAGRVEEAIVGRLSQTEIIGDHWEAAAQILSADAGEEITADFVRRTGTRFYVAVLEGRVLGVCGANVRSDPRGVVTNIAVARQFRGLGLTGRLLEQARQDAAESGVDRLIIYADNDGVSEIAREAGFGLQEEIESGRQMVKVYMKPTVIEIIGGL